jgi:hypothetical protein
MNDMMKRHKNRWIPAAGILFCSFPLFAQFVDTTPNRVCTNLDIPFERIGTLKPRSTYEIRSSNWTIGCEVLDRDYTNYDSYKDFLAPLGIKKARLQSGWAKTEKVKGVYDFGWLDHIINDLVSKKIQPWVELSYGNPIYEGGGGRDMGLGIPTSEEGLKAWERWVEAMVLRYKDRVHEWEIWNEADLKPLLNTPEMVADLNILTAEAIKRIDSDARIAGLTAAHMNVEFWDRFLTVLKNKNKLHIFDWFSYHGYPRNPDMLYTNVTKIQDLVRRYSPSIQLRQGESGCPSEYQKSLALSGFVWSELTQSKWDLRRMMGDLGQDIESSVFAIMDMVYDWVWNQKEPERVINRKGLLRSDSLKQVEKIKIAYYAVQNTVSVFDHSLARVKEMQCEIESEKQITKYLYENIDTKLQVLVMWDGTGIPTDSYRTQKAVVRLQNGNFKKPVWVDLISGRIYEIPESNWRKDGSNYIFEVPVYDSPVLITDKSIVL